MFNQFFRGQPLKRLVQVTASVVATTATGIAVNRWHRQKDDYVPNPQNLPFRNYLEEQRKLGHETAAPWTTQDAKTLTKLKKYMPEIVIPAADSMHLLTDTINIRPLNECPYRYSEMQPIEHLVVGGAPAAMVAIQTAIDGKPGIYVNFTQNALAISDGSALQGKSHRMIDRPAYESGNTPLKFFKEEIKAFVSPPRYCEEVMQPNLRWKKLGWSEWLMHPEQWFEGMQVAVGNQMLAQHYAHAKKTGLKTDTESLTQEIQQSRDYIKNLDKFLGGDVIIQPGRDSLLVTFTDASEKAATKNAIDLATEDCSLIKLTKEQVEKEFGFVPQNAKGYWKKTGDFSLRKDFMKQLTKAAEDLGCQTHHHWQLRDVYTDMDKKGGWAIFVEKTVYGEKLHPLKFSQIYLSLGAASYSKSPAPLASVAGVSCQGYIKGLELKAGKSMVFDDSNNITPLGDTRDGDIDPQTGKPERLTPIQYTNSARVKPRNMGKDWAKFDSKYALHLDEVIRNTLPPGAKLETVFCRACPRELGPEGILTWHEIGSMKIQMGAGGGGLTQSGRMAVQVAQNPENPIPQNRLHLRKS